AALAWELATFHRAGVVHHKIRRDNVYLERDGSACHLAWLGTEPPQRSFELETGWAVESFGHSVDKRTVQAVREGYAVSYCESIAPEILAGQPPSSRSDVFALGATLLCHLLEDVSTFRGLRQLRSSWTSLPIACESRLGELGPILARAVAADPSARFASAV